MKKILIDTQGGQLTAYVGKPETKNWAFATGMVRGNTLLVLDVWVPLEMRRKGLGSRLVRKLQEEAGTRRTLTSEVAPWESARGFWSTLAIEEKPEGDDWGAE